MKLIVYCHGANRYGNMYSHIADGVWYPFRLVDGGEHVTVSKERGFYEVEADSIWMDNRREGRLIGRAKGNIKVTEVKSEVAEPRVPRRGE